MISIKNLTKKFDNFTAVDNLTMHVKKGEVLGFLGPNGAGKSTTMKMITGFIKPTDGIIKVKDMNVETDSIECKKLIGYLPEGAPLYGDMTPKNMLKFVANTRGMNLHEFKVAFDNVVVQTEITDVINQPIDTLSKGYKRRVGLAQALIHNPEILILDEPTDGLDPNQKHHVRNLINDMGKKKAIIISTHILEEVDAVCSRACIIARGKKIIDNKPRELKKIFKNNNLDNIFREITLNK
ncbi:MAG: ABC transporter ATP-binding protein NatA [Alphaproteobacteria bacterium MarineAlpha6_Bin4]|nr:MAG: ABC transporter ATP-binding protein NatA [Alphaproteobacteria bacterium MarineAlpha6_Bin3]PPR37601.1 MAG: ABC transporter ATP-binding protein NatA [Alphaproteobacteria bacterium MarineAlpha6_Bin4]|tara:strand:- start:16729 stop:17445 length:717 start_codon:yes stop_codon:yes gene_type:complete